MTESKVIFLRDMRRQAEQAQADQETQDYFETESVYLKQRHGYMERCVKVVREIMARALTTTDRQELRIATNLLRHELNALPEDQREKALETVLSFGMPIYAAHGECHENNPDIDGLVIEDLYAGLVQDIPDQETWDSWSHAKKATWLASKQWGLRGFTLSDQVSYALWHRSVREILETTEGDTWDTAMVYQALRVVRAYKKSER